MSAPRRSTIVKFFGDSSGSEDDLGLEAKRIIRARKKEKEHLESLGPIVPIDSNCSNLTQQFGNLGKISEPNFVNEIFA